MKQLIKNYTFAKATNQVTFTDFTTVRLERILLITDVTNNTIIYQFNNSSLAGSVSTNVLTLTYNTNTGAFNNSDALQIMYDSAAGDPLYDLPEVTGNVASGTTDSGNPVKVGGRYNTSAPTLSNGQRADLQLDSSGNLKISSGSTLSQNITQVNGSTISLGQTTMANSLPVTLASNQSSVLVGSSSATGSAVPANAFYIGATDGSGKLQGLHVTDGDNISTSAILGANPVLYNGSNMDRTRSASTAAGTSGTGVLASGAMGIYNTSAPSASNGNYYQLQLDSSANLKVNVAAGSLTASIASDGTIGSAVPTTGIQVAGEDAASNLQSAGVMVSGTANSTGNALLSAGTTYSTTWSVSAAGTTTAVDAGNYAWVSVAITSYSSGSITFQCSNDNSNWQSITLNLSSAANTAPTVSYAAVGLLSGPLVGRYFRLSITGAGATNSGTITFSSIPRSSQAVGASGIQIASNAPTGSAVPGNAFYMGVQSSTGNLTGLNTPGKAGITGASSNLVSMAIANYVYDGSNFDANVSASTASGTSGTGLLGAGAMGIYNTSAPTAVNGDYYQLQLDASANLKVNVTNTTVAVTESGTWTVGSSSATGSAIPSSAFLVGVTDLSGNLQPASSIQLVADGNSGNKSLATGLVVYNGTNYDRVREVSAASGTTGTGLLGAGAMGIYNTSAPTASNGDYYPLQLDSSANLKVNIVAGGIGTASASINIGQQTSGTSAVQVSSTSTVPTNGIIIQALSSNLVSVFVGGSGVTTSTGFELQPGQAMSLTCNLNAIYIVGSNTTDKICWSVE